MDKYINSTKVLNFIQDCLNHEDKISDTEKATLIAIQRYIERTQIEDVAPVVRCGECGHSAIDTFGNRYCKGVAYSCSHVPDGWFCADGERKDGDGDA